MLTATLAPQGLIAAGAAADRRPRHRPRPSGAAGRPTACWPRSPVLAASLSLITVVVFRSQTLATVAESARIKYTVGPTIAWYQEFLRYYFLTVESNADGSMTRRFAVLVMLLCLFGMLVVLLRRGRVPGLASGPAWRLIGTTAIGLLLLTLHADQVGGAVRRLRRTGRRAGRGHRVHLRPDRPAQPTQPGAVRHGAAVRAGVGHLGYQRLVLRRQLRGAVVRHAARASPATR